MTQLKYGATSSSARISDLKLMGLSTRTKSSPPHRLRTREAAVTIAACTVVRSARHRRSRAAVSWAGIAKLWMVVGVPSNSRTDVGLSMRGSGSGGVTSVHCCLGPNTFSSITSCEGGTGRTGSVSPLSTARTSRRAWIVEIPSPMVWSMVSSSADDVASTSRTARISGARDRSKGSTNSSAATACQFVVSTTRSGTGSGFSMR